MARIISAVPPRPVALDPYNPAPPPIHSRVYGTGKDDNITDPLEFCESLTAHAQTKKS